MNSTFVPQNFMPPATFSSEHFFFTVLNESVAELDYKAIMSNRNSLVGIFGPNDPWPQTNLTLDENRASLAIHQQEFTDRKAFAYSILTPTKDKCLGSVYIDQSRANAYDWEVYFWLTDQALAHEKRLFNFLKHRLTTDWPYSRLAFPGRDISWLQWQKILDNQLD